MVTSQVDPCSHISRPEEWGVSEHFVVICATTRGKREMVRQAGNGYNVMLI